MKAAESEPRFQFSPALSWAFSAMVVFQCGVLAKTMARTVPIFAQMYEGTGVEVPSLTRFLLATYVWLLPLFFLALAAFVILKEFSARGLRRRLVLTASALLAAFVAPGLVILILYLPLFALIKKLGDAH